MTFRFGGPSSLEAVFLIGSWYKTEEHASRSMFFQSANAGFGIIADLVMVLGIARAAEKWVTDPIDDHR
jgi:hypothetical protein